MARSFNISYRFSAKNGFSSVSRKMRADVRRLRASFKKLNRRLRKVNREFTLTGKASKGLRDKLKGLAAAAAVYFGLRKLITVGTGLETSLADLSAITGATGKDLDKLKDKTLSMARASVTAQSDVAEGIKLVASAKPELLSNINALTATTDAVLLLKNAAGIELADAANITAQGLNIFGASADQASRFVNVLAAGAKLGSSEITDTGAALLLAGPNARAAGLSFEQLNAAIQTVAKGGIKGSQAGTALTAIFGRLRRAGLHFQELGLQGTFEKIKKGLESIKDPTKRALTEAKIFGDEHSKVGLSILNNVTLLGQYEKSLAGTNIAQEQANIRLNTTAKGAEKLSIILNEKLIKTFDFAKKGLDLTSASVKDFISGFDTADLETFGIILSGLGTIVAGLAQVFKIAFNVIMSVLNPVFAILKGIGTIVGQVIGALVTGDFSNFDLGGAFDLGGKFLGLAGGEETTGAPVASNGDVSTTDINVNMNAPAGVVDSVQSRSKGSRNANVGVNMAAG